MNRDPSLARYFYGKWLVAAGSLMLSACSAGHHSATEPSESSLTPKASATPSTQPSGTEGMPVAAALYPDMSWYLQSINGDTCYFGGARECFVRLRTYPAADPDNIVNVDPANPNSRYEYPVEAYAGKQATRMDGICEVEGKPVHSLTPGLHEQSAKWYVVRIAIANILNPAVKADAESASPSFHVERVNGQLEADVFMAAAYTRGHGSVVLPKCTTVELPENRN